MDSDQKPQEKAPPSVRTLRTDAQFYVKDKKLSPREINAQSYARQSSSLIFAPTASSNRNIILILIASVIFGGLGVGAWWLLRNAPPAPQAPSTPPLPPSLVRADTEERIHISSVNSGALVEQIRAIRNQTFPIGSLHRIIVLLSRSASSETLSTANEFALRMGWTPPGDFEEIIANNFTIVVATPKNKNEIAIVLRTNQFERALAMLLLWERTMAFDWRMMLPVLPDKKINPVSFRDELIANHDARVLTAADGTVFLAYAIFNKKNIVIATSREALSLVLDRLIALPPK